MNIRFNSEVSYDGRICTYRAYDAQTGAVLGVGYSEHGAIMSILLDVAEAAEQNCLDELAERIRDLATTRKQK